MTSERKSSADRKSSQRARRTAITQAIEDEGGPRSESPGVVGLGWYAAHLEPRTWPEVEPIAEEVGFMECLVASAATTADGGMTVQLQVLPAYVHHALDMVQRSAQGVFLLRAFQVPWEAFRIEDSPAWSHLSPPSHPELDP